MKIKVKKIHVGIIASFVIAGMAMFSSCDNQSYLVETIDPGVEILFQTDIQPIFTDNCLTCHGGSGELDLRDQKSYSSLTTTGDIVPADQTCKLYTKLNAGHPSKLNSLDRQKILQWILQGAKNN